jgi:hypothetical protein
MTVYFIAPVGGGNIKIGHTEDIERRFRHIGSWSPVPLEIVASFDGSKLQEQKLHKRFASSRLHGEWFSPTPELLAVINDVLSGNAPEKEKQFSGQYVFWDYRRDLKDNGFKVKELASHLGRHPATLSVGWANRVPAYIAPAIVEFFRERGITPKFIEDCRQ